MQSKHSQRHLRCSKEFPQSVFLLIPVSSWLWNPTTELPARFPWLLSAWKPQILRDALKEMVALSSTAPREWENEFMDHKIPPFLPRWWNGNIWDLQGAASGCNLHRDTVPITSQQGEVSWSRNKSTFSPNTLLFFPSPDKQIKNDVMAPPGHCNTLPFVQPEYNSY